MTLQTHIRLYRGLARRLMEELRTGRHPVGSKFPGERELATRYDVSRPTVREAMIALEVQGMVEVRLGSGARVLRIPEVADIPGSNITAIELTEARLLFEGEAAALAAEQIDDHELAEIENLMEDVAREVLTPGEADRAFHLAIARAARNQAVLEAIGHLWKLRDLSPEAGLLHEKARIADIKPVVDEHTAVLKALRERDPSSARAAMRAHLAAVLDSLLFATEGEVRRAAQVKRDRYALAKG